MKVADIRTHLVQIPGRLFHLVIVETEDGTIGLGESGLQRRPLAVNGAIAHLADWLIGQDAMRIEHLWQRMWRSGYYPASGSEASAVSAIDIALWDIRAKTFGVPLYQLLGGRVRDFVECFYEPGRAPGVQLSSEQANAVHGGPPEAAAAAAQALASAGHRFCRIGPGNPSPFDARTSADRFVEQVAAVRKAVPEIEIMLDLHTRFDPAQAKRLLLRLEPYDLFCVEDPLRSESVRAYEALRHATRVPLALGEQWYGKWRFAEALNAGILDFARPDVCLVGGVTEVRKVAAMCEAEMVPLLLHNPLGPVCTAVSVNLCMSLENAGPQEVGFPFSEMPQDLFDISLTVDGSSMDVSDTPGHGVVLREENAKNYPGVPTEPPYLVRIDGSYTNY